jgi:Uma2 family endonuclease
MNAVAHKLFFSAEDYLAWEAVQEFRNEYLDGQVFAMCGASDAHQTISGNLFVQLRNHLRGTPCRAFLAGMKLRVEASNAFFYPDVFVSCSARDQAPEAALYKSEPLLVAEVLSESTAAYDRGGKFAHYRQLASLREYLLIDPDSRSVDLFRLREDGHWVLYPSEGADSVELASIGLELPMAALFEDVPPAAGGDSAGNAN